MAVVPKKRKNSTSYYVCTWFSGKAFWERCGTDRREAERLDARRKREIKAGEFRPHAVVKRSTIAEYVKAWGIERRNVSASDDRRNLARFTALEDFAALHLDDATPGNVRDALNLIRKTVPSMKTVQNAYGTLRTMFRDAVMDGIIKASPCVLPRGFFKNDGAKEREPYERSEAAVLCRNVAIPAPVRTLNALCLLAGLREGEACGRRWRDLDQRPEPLWALDVRDQYGGKALKTRRPRVVPVHPELAALLEGWGRVGFVELMGRPPAPEDYIVPHPSPRNLGGHHTRSTYYKAFRRGCEVAGVRARSLHSMRHTMVTLARRGGANKFELSKVTHNAAGDIVDRYTHADWFGLCEAVLAIGSLDEDFGARPSPRRFGSDPQDPPRGNVGNGTPLLADSSSEGEASRLQFPAPPPINQPETSKCQSSSQSYSVGIGALWDAARGPVGPSPVGFPSGANGPAQPMWRAG